MLSYWAFVVAVLVLLASFFVPGGPASEQVGRYIHHKQSQPEHQEVITGITINVNWSDSIISYHFTMGGLNYIITIITIAS